MKKLFQTLICLLIGIIFTIASNSYAQQAEESASAPQPSKVRIAFYADKGASSNEKKKVPECIAKDNAFELVNVTAQEIRDGVLDQYDLFILPGGLSKTQAKTLESVGMEKVKAFIESGKGYMGICAGAYVPVRAGWVNASFKHPRGHRGKATLKIELSEEGKKILPQKEKYNGQFNLLYVNGPCVNINENPDMPKIEVLAWFRTEVSHNKTVPGLQINSPAIYKTTCGKGTMIVLSPHPELTPGMEELLLDLLHHLVECTRLVTYGN